MNKENLINQIVDEAYYNLTSLAKVKATVLGGYFGIIIPESKFDKYMDYIDEIINKLFTKFCHELTDKITEEDLKTKDYYSFCFNKPSKELIEDCYKIVNDNLTNKKSSNTTLFESLNTLRKKYDKNEIEKSLNTIFDILLYYYCTKEK